MFSKRYLPTGFKGRNWLQALATDFSHGLPQIASYFDLEERNKLLLSYYVSSNSISVEDIWQKRVPDVDDLLQRATLMICMVKLDMKATIQNFGLPFFVLSLFFEWFRYYYLDQSSIGKSGIKACNWDN